MKPSPFDYHAPTQLSEAIGLLSELGDEAKLLSGGQSLVPLMNMRLARPEHVVDLNRVTGLSDLSVDQDRVRVGAMVRHRQLERSAELVAANPLVAAAASLIAHFQIRERGTIGGSLAHADPSAELPLVACLLDADIEAQGPSGVRRLTGSEFFTSVFTTQLDESEVLTGVAFRHLDPAEGWAFEEVARRHGDFAIVATAATTLFGEDGRYAAAGLAIAGVGAVPQRLDAISLVGELPSDRLWRSVAAEASSRISPQGDIHATAEDRHDLARTLIIRSLSRATQRAKGGDPR
ncbi:MAG: molybdopterin dehydrogenase FAD-binding protein [Nocardioides sp.]|nr:molybdopterin dehydrogenase FAD-binding protein [Nocardioides sp.]